MQNKQEIIQRIKNILVPQPQYFTAFFIKAGSGKFRNVKNGELLTKEEVKNIKPKPNHTFIIIPASRAIEKQVYRIGKTEIAF